MTDPYKVFALASTLRDGKWPNTMDAKVWVDEWMARVITRPEMATDFGTMLAWFANAIMAGYDAAQQRLLLDPHPETLDLINIELAPVGVWLDESEWRNLQTGRREGNQADTASYPRGDQAPVNGPSSNELTAHSQEKGPPSATAGPSELSSSTAVPTPPGEPHTG
jgi:hypothetical protein